MPQRNLGHMQLRPGLLRAGDSMADVLERERQVGPGPLAGRRHVGPRSEAARHAKRERAVLLLEEGLHGGTGEAGLFSEDVGFGDDFHHTGCDEVAALQLVLGSITEEGVVSTLLFSEGWIAGRRRPGVSHRGP